VEKKKGKKKTPFARDFEKSSTSRQPHKRPTNDEKESFRPASNRKTTEGETTPAFQTEDQTRGRAGNCHSGSEMLAASLHHARPRRPARPFAKARSPGRPARSGFKATEHSIHGSQIAQQGERAGKAGRRSRWFGFQSIGGDTEMAAARRLYEPGHPPRHPRRLCSGYSIGTGPRFSERGKRHSIRGWWANPRRGSAHNCSSICAFCTKCTYRNTRGIGLFGRGRNR